MFKLEYKVNHVFTHWRAVDSVDKSAILKPSVFRLHFLHYLFAKRTNLSRTCDGHVFVALVSEREIIALFNHPSSLESKANQVIIAWYSLFSEQGF